MTYVSDHPVSVDGVRLDTLAWGIESAGLTIGGLRQGNAVLAGVDGEVASLEDARDAGSYGLSMFVRGCDPDGAVPASRDQQAVMRANLDELLHLFARTDSLLDVREVVESDTVPGTVLGELPGVERQFWGKVEGAISPTLEPGAAARFTVVLSNPSGYWRDPASADWSHAGVVTGTTYDVTTLEGSSGPVDDAVFLLEGPADAGVQIVDARTGAFVRLNTALGAGNGWRVDSGAWESRSGAVDLNTAPTAGTDAAPVTDQGGRYPRLLRLTPYRSGTVRKVSVKVVGTGFTGATTLRVRARRAYL